jgi:hypothetical protein
VSIILPFYLLSHPSLVSQLVPLSLGLETPPLSPNNEDAESTALHILCKKEILPFMKAQP